MAVAVQAPPVPKQASKRLRERIFGPGKIFRPLKKRPKRIPFWDVYMFDTLTDEKKHYGLPITDVHRIPREAWKFPDLGIWRWYGALGLPLVLVLPALALIIAEAPAYTILAVFLSIPITLLLVVVGFWKGPAIMAVMDPFSRPFCLLYRAVITEDTDSGPESEIKLEPIRYTSLTGVDPLILDALVNNMLVEQAEKVMAQAEKTGKDPSEIPMPEYQAIVNRASDAWEDIHGTLEKEDTYIPMTTAQKLQIGSIVTMAIASVLIAFLVVIATTTS